MENPTEDFVDVATGRILHIMDDPNTLILFAGPLTILLFMALSFFVLTLIKRRKDRTILESIDSSQVANKKQDVSRVGVLTRTSETKVADAKNWLERLQEGLAKTKVNFSGGLREIFSSEMKLSDELLGQVHEVLYRSDFGVKTTDHLVAVLKKDLRSGENVNWEMVQSILKNRIENIFKEQDRPFNKPTDKPWVILIAGVNGVGKTTTIAKLAATFLSEEKTVLLAAADTYRAAAIEQLQVWGKRLGVDVISHKHGGDPAAVAYDAVKAALSRQSDVLIIDTAGRLHNKKELMDELGKINRVIGKDLGGAPHETWLVIDATTGQNAVQQVRAFSEVIKISGLIVTKLDGTAKGGVIVGIADQFKLPIRFIGIGEKASDLQAFSAKDFTDSIF